MTARTARSWFATLPPESRSSALAITDTAFLKLFLWLAERSDAAPPSIVEITTMYLQFTNETPVVHSNGKRSKNKSTTQSNQPQIETSMPPKPKAEVNTPTLNEETPNEVLTSPASSEEKLTKLLNMLISHVCAIFPSVFSGDLNEVERLRVGDTTPSFNRGKGKRGRKQPYNGDTIAALTLDPSILGSPGGSSLFYNLADKIVDLIAKERGVEGNTLGFLMQGDGSWPTWMILGNDENEESKQMLGIFLLAGFQMSIENSYQRWVAKHMESGLVSTVKVGDILLSIGGEQALHTLWQWSPQNTGAASVEADADAKMSEEIERIFRIKKSYAEDKNSAEKMLALLSREEIAQLEANFQFEGNLKAENLLVTPLPCILSCSPATQVCQNWNRLMMGVWSKMARSLSNGGGGGSGKKNQKQEGSLLALEDIESLGDVPMSPNKKKKKKNKKKHKKKTIGHDGSNQVKAEQAQPEQSNSSAKAVDPVPSTDQSSVVAVKETEASPLATACGDTQEDSADYDATAVEVTVPPSINRDVEENPSTDILPNPDATNEVGSDKPPAEAKVEKAPTETIPATKDQEGSKENDDAEDVWETVAAKPRKPKAKSSNDQQSNNNNSSSNNNTTNKPNSQNNRSQSSRNNGNATPGEGGGSNDRRKKKNRRDKNRGKRDQTRVVKDVLTQILDAVDNEVNRRAKQGVKSVSSEDRRRSANDKRSVQSNNRNSGNEQRRKAAAAPSTANNAKDPRSLRDIVAGVSASPAKTSAKVPSGAQNKAKPAAEPARGAKIKPGLSYRSVIEPTPQQPAIVSPSTTNQSKAASAKASELKVSDVKTSIAAEKETTKPKGKSVSETEAKNAPPTTPSKKESATPVVETDSKVTSAKEDSCQTPASTTEDDCNTPPLSTLLGPGTSCSASSSVASSLEAPHSSRFRHQSISATEAVGVHLLNVCKQMSEEIDTFMSRRSLALDVRRKERSAVLGALQDTLVKIWPGSCHVEMYGSCATQLDLPSSDLDLVVCGLDEMMMSHIPIDHAASGIMETPTGSVNTNLHQSPADSAQNLNQSFENSVHSLPPQSPGHLPPEPQTPNHLDFDASQVDLDPASDQLTEFVPEGEPGMVYDAPEEDVTMGMEGYNNNADYHATQQDYFYVPYNYIPPMSLNAQRVLRLASELEMQPWAVQVKAIPTAAVPVVKMLADPSRLPGAVGSGSSWMMQQHIAAQAGAPGTPPSSSSHFFSQPSMPSWRGADIMNGLQPVDITFEGPEHGGIGSTTYSACVVQDACNETGLPPESTPVVQVAMVLKELLAQRRLNEPFSGGLSSYALLLLLLAVLKDRRVIQEEMERVEKQRREVERLDARDTKVSQKQNNPFPRMSAAQIVAGKSKTSKPSKESKIENASSAFDSPKKSEVAAEKKAEVPNPISKKTSSWASIAKKSNGSTALTDSISTATSSMPVKKNANEKSQPVPSSKDQAENMASKNAATPIVVQSGSTMNSVETESEPAQSKITSTLPQSKVTIDGQVTPSTAEESKLRAPLIPQCSNDILEVLCSGELTAGKLLMHFLLFYGQQFDAQTTLIDINGTHHPEFGRMDREKLSPFVPRPPGGTIDPFTGMYSVDPIVVYDPLEGAIDHNVSKRCYCWNNVRWVFAQCYMTVSSVVETSGTGTKNANKTRHRGEKKAEDSAKATKSSDRTPQEPSGNNSDITTPILELLLSF